MRGLSIKYWTVKLLEGKCEYWIEIARIEVEEWKKCKKENKKIKDRNKNRVDKIWNHWIDDH